MRAFATLYEQLDASTSTEAKVAALAAHFASQPPADAAWAVALLAGQRPRLAMPSAVMRAEAVAAAGVPEWLFEMSYQRVGDLAETVALMLPDPGPGTDLGLAAWMDRLAQLRALPPGEQAARLRAWWQAQDAAGRFLLVKLIGGGFRVGVGRLLVQRALGRASGLDPKLLAQRLIGWGPPDAQAWSRLVAPAPEAGAVREDGLPYPFYLAHAIEAASTGRERPPEEAAEWLAARLGPVADWVVEWKFDGIRAQLVRRGAQGVWLWSRGEELMDGRFPEIEQAAAPALPPGTVLDGELLVWPAGESGPRPFQSLQTRLQRKTVSRKLLLEAPVRFLAYDLLEADGVDRRSEPLAERRARLEALAATWPADGPLGLSARLQPDACGGDDAAAWRALAQARASARERGLEGLMLKHRAAPYGQGRTKPGSGLAGGWWKWKLEPLTCDAVLLYAQAGHGRRAGLHTDYTFALWNRPPRDAAEAQAVADAIARREPPVDGGLQLVTFAKAYGGLTDAEFRRVDAEVRRHTVDRFGPVRSLKPTLVIELGFEGIQASPRHRSGLAVRFPRMLRLREDKPLHEADNLDGLRRLQRGVGG